MTFQDKVCLVFTCAIGANMVSYVISRDRDSRPLTGFNDISIIQRAVSGSDLVLQSMAASFTICICVS